jgi:hypothetical protein
MQSRNRDGSIDYVPGQVVINEFILERVAAMTGGRYFRATDEAALHAIYGEIDRLAKARHMAESYQKYEPLNPPVEAHAGPSRLPVVMTDTGVNRRRSCTIVRRSRVTRIDDQGGQGDAQSGFNRKCRLLSIP